MDASRVKQVLHNLIGNALKFTARGGVGIAVAMTDHLLRFRISDSGEGIPPDAIERIFDAFEQGPSHTAPARSGAGLGLTISRRLARAMGGDVTCRLRPASAPRSSSRSPSGRHRRRRHRARRSARSWPRPARPRSIRWCARAACWWSRTTRSTRWSCAACWSTWASTPSSPSTAVKALARMGQTAYDLVLMDARCPSSTVEATRLWRARETRLRQNQRVPIVALTASAAGERERCSRRDGRLPQQAGLARGVGRAGRSLPGGLRHCWRGCALIDGLVGGGSCDCAQDDNQLVLCAEPGCSRRTHARKRSMHAGRQTEAKAGKLRLAGPSPNDVLRRQFLKLPSLRATDEPAAHDVNSRLPLAVDWLLSQDRRARAFHYGRDGIAVLAGKQASAAPARFAGRNPGSSTRSPTPASSCSAPSGCRPRTDSGHIACAGVRDRGNVTAQVVEPVFTAATTGAGDHLPCVDG